MKQKHLLEKVLGLGALALALAAGCSTSECLDGATMGDDGVCSAAGVDTNVKCADGAVVQTADDCAGHGGITGTASQCAARQYKSFEGATLDVGVVDETPGRNRSRIKPYAVLGAEILRVTGVNVSTTLTGLADTFGDDPARWYSAPAANAVSTVALYDLTFEACLGYTATAPEFAVAPTQETATAQCTAMERKFWNRTPNPAEVGACANNAVTNTAPEKDARRRWAYTCAAVLSATGFLTY